MINSIEDRALSEHRGSAILMKNQMANILFYYL